MDAIIRGATIFLFLMLVFRVAGKRTLAQTTNFDFVLLLIISEVTGQAMIGKDNSITNAMILIVTLVGCDMALSLLKRSSKLIERLIDGTPVPIIQNGQKLQECMNKERVDEQDVLAAARTNGLERIDQIKLATLETDGEISIVPR